MSKTVMFQTIQFSIQKQFHFKQRSLNVKTVLFQAIQFTISTNIFSTWPIKRTLSGATTPGQSGPESDGNERVLWFSQSSSIIETARLDCFVSYPGHSAEKKTLYSTAPAYWAIHRVTCQNSSISKTCLAYVRRLDVETVPYQPTQFSYF